jgi:predicted transposase/invertase (TIGR01784 family)
MKPQIDPRIDCVFKALLGAEENRDLLIHFLNAVLGGELPSCITFVDILNPYNDKEFLNDKLSVVDIKARDAQNQSYQIEIQLLTHRHLPARILYGWADLYSEQLKSGQDFSELRPVYAIWLLGEELPNDEEKDYARNFQMRDATGRRLVAHGGIWVLELGKFVLGKIETEQDRWLRFFVEGESLDDEALPAWMDTQEMRRAMGTLRKFSEKERQYHEYQARQNYLRQQRSLQVERQELEEAHRLAELALEQEREEKAAAIQEKQAAIQEKQAAIQEKQAAIQEKQAAIQEKQAAAQREIVAMQEKDAAVAELERLKALLSGKQ